MTGAGAALSPSQSDAEGDDDSFDEGPDTETADSVEGIEADAPPNGSVAESAGVEMAPPPHAPEPPAPAASMAPAPEPPAPEPSSPPADAPRDSSVTPPVTDPSGT